MRYGFTERYLPKKPLISTTTSLTTGRPGSGATEIFLPSWSTRMRQASRFRLFINIASEPQMPCPQERRKLSEPSCSAFTLISRSRTRSIGSTVSW
jgi:hypothetical protein